MKSLRLLVVASLLGAWSVYAAPAQAGVTFGRITSNSPTNVASQLKLDLFDLTSSAAYVEFLFSWNTGALAGASITDVYFEDGTLVALDTITNGPGVLFSRGASPGNLPGGNGASPPFNATVGFNSDSAPPTVPNGVQPGEWLKIGFTLQSGKTALNTLNALNNGTLRIGLHVQNINGDSDSFINKRDASFDTQVPEPASLAVWGLLSLVGCCGLHRRNRASV